MARIGIIALIVGVAFFLKFAFDQNWLGPSARVTLGVLAGAALVVLGYYWRNRYPTLSQALSGGGIALFYLSFFSAFAIFSLIPLYPAVSLLLLVSIGSAFLANKYNSMALAIIGIIGAFAAPFIIGIGKPGGIRIAPSDRGIQLIVYILIVDVGALVLSTFRNWRWFTLLALSGSLLAFAGWEVKFGHIAGLLTKELFITLIFLIFFGATSLFHVIWRKVALVFDYVLISVNTAAYLIISYAIMWHDLHAWMGGFTLLLVLLYGSLAYAAFHRGGESARISLFTLTVAIILLTIAVPVQLGDSAWTTIAWAVEMAALVWLSFVTRLTILRSYSYGAFVIMAGRLLFFDTTVNIRTFQPVLNERFLAYAVAIAACYVAPYLLWRYREKMPEWHAPASTFLIAANFFTLWLLSFEVWNSFSRQLAGGGIVSNIHSLRNAQNLSLTALWAVYALILLVIGIVKRWRTVRLAALGLLAATIIKVFVYDVFALEQVYRIIAFVGLGVLLLTGAYLYQRYSKAIRGFLSSK